MVYIGLKDDKLSSLKSEYEVFDSVYYIPSGKFRRYHGESFWRHLIDFKTLFLNARDFFRAIHGVFVARKLLKKIKPSVIFSKGGFVSVPVGITAHWQHLPIVTHDSDTVPGLANRIIGRWAAIHATGMPSDLYNYPKETIRYTGIPISIKFQPVSVSTQVEFKQKLGLASDDLVLMVAGGGLGSKNVNELVTSIAPHLMERFPKLNILHVTGTSHESVVAAEYQSVLDSESISRVQVVGFSDEIYKYSGAADLIIARAGATTLAEFATQAKACIIIPSPFLTGGHQLKNASLLEKTGVAEVLPNDIGKDKLLTVVTALLSDGAKRASLSKKLASTAVDNAAEKLAQVVLEAAEQRTAG